MTLLDDLLASLPDGEVLHVSIGLHWTAVVVRSDGQERCGLASTLTTSSEHFGEATIAQAGQLHTLAALELAQLAGGDHPTLASVGAAAINALLPPPAHWETLNAEEVIAARGVGKMVAMIGSFPFVPRLRPRVGELLVLERDPKADELPASAAPDVLPRAEVVAITGMTFVNHSLEDLLARCAPHATVLVMGASTPLSPVLFDHGVDILSGSLVTEIEPVLRAVQQGATFRQIHKAGVQLVTLRCPEARS